MPPLDRDVSLDDRLGGAEPLPDVPSLPEPQALEHGPYAGFAYSMQGASHIKKGSPCQDRCEMRYLPKQKTLIAAIADGLGRGRQKVLVVVLDELLHADAESVNRDIRIGERAQWRVESLGLMLVHCGVCDYNRSFRDDFMPG